MVVTLDLGEERLLHPLNKQAFGHRLALWARANVYRENIVWSGPLVVSAKRAGNSTLVRFEHAEGLKAKQDPVIGFEYRAGDNTWKTVTAHIRDNHVVITNPPGESPRAIRYAWANNPQHNLVNAAGLPASPFLIDFTTTHPAYDSNRR